MEKKIRKLKRYEEDVSSCPYLMASRLKKLIPEVLIL